MIGDIVLGVLAFVAVIFANTESDGRYRFAYLCLAFLAVIAIGAK